MQTDTLFKLNVFVADKDIISDDDQMRLIAMRDGHRNDYFEIGHIANRYVRMSASSELPVTAARVYEAIARFAGKQPRTIRYYAETAAFYEEKNISDFEMLPFSFFVLAQRHGEIAWRSVLEYAALNPYISLEELERASAAGQFQNFEKSEIFASPSEKQGGVLDISTLDTPALSPQEPQTRVLSKFAANILLTVLSDMIGQALRVLGMVAISGGLRSRLELDIQDLKEAMPDLAREIAELETPGKSGA